MSVWLGILTFCCGWFAGIVSAAVFMPDAAAEPYEPIENITEQSQERN
jgi:hypothetical protein